VPDLDWGTVARWIVPLLVCAVCSGCKSSAAFTLPAAAINTAVAVGFSAAQRSMGGCVATCTNGTACNPATGLCERVFAETCSCPGGQVCVEGSRGMTRCVPMSTTTIIGEKDQVSGAATVVDSQTGAVSIPLPPVTW
jgi:hypothetical protein